MKLLIILLVTVVAAVYSQGLNNCFEDVEYGCKDPSGMTDTANLKNCNAMYSGISFKADLQSYANAEIARSYHYLLLATNFGTFEKNRKGFHKLFKGLSDEAWDAALGIIEHVTTRGGSMNFTPREILVSNKKPVYETDEMSALAATLDVEKQMALEVHTLHRNCSHANHRQFYDPEIALYLQEKFFKTQAATIRKISGYTNDLMKLIGESEDGTQKETSLSTYLFDEYLQKQ